MREIKPKPCPFCKHFAGFSVILPYEEDPGHVTCIFCGAESPFDVWNDRPIEDALQARVADMELELNNTKFHVKTLQSILTKSLDCIRKLKEAQRWIPVSEQPKETGEYITLKQKEGKRFVDTAGYTKNNDYWWSDHHVTHWMPLPELPEDISHEPA